MLPILPRSPLPQAPAGRRLLPDQARSARRRNALRPLLEGLERRCLLADIFVSGTINTDRTYDNPSDSIFFDGNTRIEQGATLRIGPNVPVTILRGVTLTVNNGEFDVDNAGPFRIEGRVIGDSRSGSVVVAANGVMDVSGTTITATGNPIDTRIDVQGGGRLRASDSTIALGQVILANLSRLEEGDLVRNRIDSTLSINATDLYKLDDNRRFQDIIINPGGLGAGQAAELSLRGTETTEDLRYRFDGSFVIDTGAALTVRPTVDVLIQRGSTLTVSGALSVDQTDSFRIEGRVIGDSRSGSVVVTANGVMDVSGTTITATGNPIDTRIDVQGGGRLRASDSTIDLGQLILRDGSVLKEGDLVRNRIDSTLSINATDLHKLDDNRRFQDININPGELLSGESVELRSIGTDDIDDLRFVFPGNFTIANGASLAVRPSVLVLIRRGSTFTVGGTLSVDNGGPFQVEGPVVGDSRFGSVVVAANGVMDVTDTTIVEPSGNRAEIIVRADGSLSASGSTFGLHRLVLENGSTASLRSNFLNRRLEVHSGANIDMIGNSIDVTNAAEVFATGPPTTEIDLRYNFWGTSVTSQIEAGITHRPDNDPATRPLVLFQPFLSNANQENIKPGVLVLPRSGLITTPVKPATFTLRLERPPTAPVTINLSSSDPSIGNPNLDSLTFTPENWSEIQVVTIESTSEVESDYSIITSAAISDDELYDGRIVADVLVRNLSSSATNVIVEQAANLETIETGDPAEFTVRLTRRPTADVTINLTSSNPDEGEPSQSILTFNTANWATPRTITVLGKPDQQLDGDTAFTISGTISSNDRMFNDWPFPIVSIVNRDVDTAEVLVTGTSGLTTTEAGDTASFSVRLSSRPTANVTVDFTSSDPSEGELLQPSFTFTPANWYVPQTVTVQGLPDDGTDDGDVPYIITGVATSDDVNFNGREMAAVSVVNEDNDTTAILASPTSNLSTTEAGGTRTLNIRLGARPTAPVTVDFTSSNTSEGVLLQSSLTFTPANWSIPQSITVQGVDDDVDDFNIVYQINGVARSDDPNFDGLVMQPVSIANLNDDTAGVTLSQSSLSINRVPGPNHSRTFSVVLDSQPIGNVTFDIASGNPSMAEVDVNSITFTPANWNVPQTATVTGVFDGTPSSPTPFPVVVEVSASADPKYSAGSPQTVQITESREPIEVEGDYDGDGRADLALYHFDQNRGVGVFSILRSIDNQTQLIDLPDIGSNSVPVSGDFDGDGITDVAVSDPLAIIGTGSVANATVWTILLSGSNNERREVGFGGPETLDRPAPADYDGDGITDIATFRASSDLVPGAAQWFILPSNGSSAFDVVFGAPGGTDLPAPADLDGDGRADIVTFRPLRTDLDIANGVPEAAQWFVLPSSLNDMSFSGRDGAFRYQFGASGNTDQPSVADFNNDGRADIVAFRSVSDLAPGAAQWFILPSTGGPTTFAGGFPLTFGTAGEIAAVADYDGYGRPSYTVFNRSTGEWTIDAARTNGQLFGNPRTIRFDPTGGRGVPVLSPLFFRLEATQNEGGTVTTAASRRSNRSKLMPSVVDQLLPDLVSDS
ncbi:FG-GAP repeat domain-containing protein [Tautonia rosea]|uniref:FG-GAP repeat domain-containing protein n=1 Tax=Tautonia rosea TaxID=2728037 RepID=UPI0014751A46|nr:VCBS repeat-containing protein [Tautonia rosea]